MNAKMVTAGAFTYYEKDGIKNSVNYSIPSANNVTLAAANKWSTGTSIDILGDIMSGKIVISDACGATVDFALCNSTLLKYIAKDSTVMTLLQKQAFGNGDLFGQNMGSLIGVRPAVLGSLFGIPNFVIYDEKFVVSEYLTAAVAAGGTTVYVGNAADFETGTAVLHDISAGTTESVTISAIDTQAGTLTVAATTSAFKQGEDKITQTLPYIPNNKFIMMASTVEGQRIAEFHAAPYGNNRVWGVTTDQWENKDPDGVFIRVQDKGIPILYQRDAIYILTAT